MTMEQPIKSYSIEGLQDLMQHLGQPSFRARQLFEWLYLHHATSYDDMTNLPASLRKCLTNNYPLYPSKIIDKQVSQDGTKKYVIEFHDRSQAEAVAIPSNQAHERMTVCFSTQIGCPIGCTFCATGKEGFTRNLTPGEIVDQILISQSDTGKRVTNIVAMGQGEPFLNYDNVLAALRILNSSQGLAIGARHITLSTCGIFSGIERLSSEPEQFTLAVSLHAARQQVRNQLMPHLASYPLSKLRAIIEEYLAATNRRVTFEYIMIKGVNDLPPDRDALLEFCDGLLCHVNLIPINTVEDFSYQPSSKETQESWIQLLQKQGTEATVRNSRGNDIAGACGQLKNKLSS